MSPAALLLLLLPPPLLLLLLLDASPGEGLQCFKCRSDQQPQCADPVDNSTLQKVDCSQEAFPEGEPGRFCSKMRSEVNGKTVYLRACSDREGLCPNALGAGICSTCARDLCNAAPAPAHAHLGAGALAALLAPLLATMLL